jgi:uncharacterized protein with PIN domain
MIVVKPTDVPKVSTDTKGTAAGVLVKQKRITVVEQAQKRGRLSKRLCLQCGDELALSFNPSRMSVAKSARAPMTEWRCSTCGSTFSSEQLRAAKPQLIVPGTANS